MRLLAQRTLVSAACVEMLLAAQETLVSTAGVEILVAQRTFVSACADDVEFVNIGPVVPVSTGQSELAAVLPASAAAEPDELVTIPLALAAGGPGAPVGAEVAPASSTGHTVVETTTMSVVTDPILAGQSVTEAAHEVMEYTEVLKTVLTVHC